MPDETTEPEVITEMDEPVVEYEADPDELICPDGFPPKTWDKWGDGSRRAYLDALANSARITGGK